MVIGAVLMLSALLLFLYNQIEAKIAGNASGKALSAVQEAIRQEDTSHMAVLPGETAGEEGESPTETADEDLLTEPEELTVVNIEGYDYIGYLSIPALELELPIQAEVSEERLYKSPCLQFGSPITDDAVIAGHNYKYHFLPLHNIEVGEKVTFTYMNGFTVEYAVTEHTIVDPTNIPVVQDSGHDLVMYTCTSGGASRVAVFCDRVEENPS